MHVKQQQLADLSAVELCIGSWSAASVSDYDVCAVCVCACHSHPEFPESCQSVLQSLLLAGGQLCYMSLPLLLFLLIHRGN